MNNQFRQGRRVLLTGATGFLGLALLRALDVAGARLGVVRGKSSTIDALAGFGDRIVHFDNDDTGQDAAIRFTAEDGAVMHVATCYGLRGELAVDVFENNTAFPLRLLQKAETNGVRVFLNVDTVLPPQISAYALSKHQFAEWGRYFAEHREDFCFLNIRMEHLYGAGGDSANFVTQMIKRCLANEPTIALTEGLQRRDFLHVDDARNGLVILLEKAMNGDFGVGYHSFDLGSGDLVSIRDLVQTIHRLTGSSSQLCFGALPYRKGEIMESRSDSTALRGMGWRSSINLESGLQQLISAEKSV